MTATPPREEIQKEFLRAEQALRAAQGRKRKTGYLLRGCCGRQHPCLPIRDSRRESEACGSRFSRSRGRV